MIVLFADASRPDVGTPDIHLIAVNSDQVLGDQNGPLFRFVMLGLQGSYPDCAYGCAEKHGRAEHQSRPSHGSLP
jgi:hypothetical protein